MRTINPKVLHMNIKNCLGKRDNPFRDAESEQSDNSSPIKNRHCANSVLLQQDGTCRWKLGGF